jgi:hypothetical protein
MSDDDIFGQNPLTYTDILLQIEQLRSEVDNLDDDSLVDEVAALQFNIEGRESNRIHKIALKNFSNQDISEKDRDFLKNIYLTYYSAYAILVDDEEDDHESNS